MVFWPHNPAFGMFSCKSEKNKLAALVCYQQKTFPSTAHVEMREDILLFSGQEEFGYDS